jgi:2-iminobutanoate/2-iminopropanoate deaminase
VDQIAKTTVFLADMADYGALNEAYTAFFGEHRPARSAVAVAGLPFGALVEIEAWVYTGA